MSRLCVVGAGAWGRNHVRTLHELDLLGGVCDSDPARLGALAETYPGVRTFERLEDALAVDWRGLTVATPAHTHFQVASTILKAGFPVLVEKPLALSAAEARELLRVAEASGQELMVGHLMLFHPAIRKIKALLDAGRIGRVQYIYSNRVNLGTVRTEENILWSFAPHDISIFQYLLQAKPIEVIARGGAYLQPDIHDTTLTMLRYPGNVMCHNYVSWLHPFKEHRLVLIGSKGMLRFEDTVDREALLFYEKGIDFVRGEPIKRDGNAEVIEYETEQPLTAELRYFAQHCRSKIEHADGPSAVAVLEVLELAGEQLAGSADDNGAREAHANGSYFVHDTARIDRNVEVGPGTKVWHFSHVQEGAVIGEGCSLGQNVNVGSNVRIGNGVRIQNNVSVFEGVELEDHVFCGPSMTFTNVLMPRARYPTGSHAYGRTLVREGASIGAKAVIVCGVEVGRHSFVGAGAVVTKDVPDYALVVGSPAKQVAWVTEGGEKIPLDFRGEWRCKISDTVYRVTEQTIEPINA